MADIDIVPKQSSHVWLWVILAVVIVALAFWYFNRQPTRSTRAEGAAAIHAMSQPAPLALASPLAA